MEMLARPQVRKRLNFQNTKSAFHLNGAVDAKRNSPFGFDVPLGTAAEPEQICLDSQFLRAVVFRFAAGLAARAAGTVFAPVVCRRLEIFLPVAQCAFPSENKSSSGSTNIGVLSFVIPHIFPASDLPFEPLGLLCFVVDGLDEAGLPIPFQIQVVVKTLVARVRYDIPAPAPPAAAT